MSMLFCSKMAIRDTLRLRGALAATTMIVLGICLPLVLLLGLTNGIVRQQEENMLRSPTACQLSLWTTGSTTSPLTRQTEFELCQAQLGIRVIIPSTKKVVDMQFKNTSRTVAGLTLLPTTPVAPFPNEDYLH